MENMKLTFVNVGYGKAILLECPDARFEDGIFVMLIGGGGAEEAEFAERSSGRRHWQSIWSSRSWGTLT